MASEVLMRRLLSLAVAASLLGGGVVRADEPPRPPEGRHVFPLAQGSAWTAPSGGGVCLDMPAATYQIERVRYYEERIRQAEARAESTPWRIVVAAVGAGLAVGATVALARK